MAGELLRKVLICCEEEDEDVSGRIAYLENMASLTLNFFIHNHIFIFLLIDRGFTKQFGIN